MLFSERYGYTKPREALQIESVDEPLRNRLWNVLAEAIFNKLIRLEEFGSFLQRLWHGYFKKNIDSIPYDKWINDYNYKESRKEIKEYFYGAQWFQQYDFVEYCVKAVKDKISYTDIEGLFNSNLESEKAGYRLINSLITPITNESEIQGIKDAIGSTENHALKSVNTHLKAALTKLSDRQNPDYRNSIKESISAIEALVNIINGGTKGTLGASIKKLKTKITIHPALESGFNSIYGYTNDADGIRHAMMGEADSDFDDAKYMLVSCSAFVNYLIGKASKAGLLSA
ncbi:hypothetical protein QQ054_35405 [Oscillatoria amoena NRMC-F 0135]|nr:hypothetical protein [Oscillatoria amoena NRMC-F 0135]